MLKGFLIACVVAMTLGAMAGFAIPADASNIGTDAVHLSP